MCTAVACEQDMGDAPPRYFALVQREHDMRLCAAPARCSIYLKRLVNPTRKADDGWKTVRYNNRWVFVALSNLLSFVALAEVLCEIQAETYGASLLRHSAEWGHGCALQPVQGAGAVQSRFGQAAAGRGGQ